MFYFPQNAVSFSVQVILTVFRNYGLKFKYQPERLKVKQIPTSAAHYFSSIPEVFTPV